jgi:arabidopsis histidine kinase 2/3/4 (cytokinin receptor)
MSALHLNFWRNQKKKLLHQPPVAQQQQKQQQHAHSPPKGAGKWRKKLLLLFVLLGITMSIWLFWYMNKDIILRREETLANMCDERARMLQDQFNVSMNHVHALVILVSTFHHGKHPSAIDQVKFPSTLNFSFYIEFSVLIVIRSLCFHERSSSMLYRLVYGGLMILFIC